MALSFEGELRVQYKLLTNIQNFIVNSIDKVGAHDRTQLHFETRLKLLDEYWVTFCKRNDALESEYTVEFENEDYFKLDEFSVGELAYTAAKVRLLEELKKFQPASTGAQPPTNDQHYNNAVTYAQPASQPPPKLNVPTFDGSQGEWDTFKEMFTSLVINDNRITEVQKLQHLLNNVKGPAKAALKGLAITTVNFRVAWEKLVRRYDVKKRRLHVYLENLINLSPVLNKSAEALSTLVDKAEESYQGLVKLECPVEHYDIWFVHLIVRRLDPETREDWTFHEEKVEGFSTYKSLLSFLEQRIISLTPPLNVQNNPQDQSHKKQSKQSNSNENTGKTINSHVTQETSKPKSRGKQKPPPKCLHCSEPHLIYNCPKFLALSTSERINSIKSKGLCENCFSTKHATAACASPHICKQGGCKQKHNTLLHREAHTLNSLTTLPELKLQSSEASHCTFSKRMVLLPTAQVTLTNKSGTRVTVNALVDQGSMRSFVSKRVVSALELQTNRTDVNIRVLGNVTAGTTKNFCRLDLSSRFDNFNLEFNALIVGEVTSQLPLMEIKESYWPHLDNLQLADPEFLKPKRIDCLLGAEVYPRIILDGLKYGPAGAPIAQRTRLGWIISGLTDPIDRDCLDTNTGFCINSFFSQNDAGISNALQQMWEIDKIPTKSFLTSEEAACEKHFCETTVRIDGRFGVRLPFNSKPAFPGSREIALKSFSRLMTRLGKSPDLKVAYDKFMHEYLALKHMELVPVNEIDKPDVYYLPHHPVFHNNKIRVVFNGSMPSHNCISLNSTLHTGQKLQQDIALLLIRWRFFGIVFTCDIVKMYRQISILAPDRDWLRIVYDFGDGLKHFRLCTVTYGTACAPFQALRVMRQLVLEHGSHSSELKQLFQELSYVDDFFGGADTCEEAIHIRDELIKVLKSAHFELSKWSSNHARLVADLISVDQTDKTVNFQDFTSALGLKWAPVCDRFSYCSGTVSLQTEPVTKRQVLSETSKLFDPLGWIAPILVPFKIFLQDLWIDGLDWDAPLSEDLSSRWRVIRSHLDGLENITIPRWLGCISSTQWSLHGFADASKRAYSACLYYVPVAGRPVLLCSKSKVAPVNTLSITRLELSAAQLLARLIAYISPSLNVKPGDTHCWSDSRNVLCMLKIAPAKLKVFEANRVSEIITTLPNVRWRYVPTSENPADCATRGLSAEALSCFTLWWTGPPWLQDITKWPDQMDLKPSTPLAFNASIQAIQEDPTSWFDRFSSFSKFVRVIAMARRWLHYKRQNIDNGMTTSLSAQELKLARAQILRIDQSHHFQCEITKLNQHQLIPRRSKIARLKPFLDEDGILRAASRTENCPFLTYSEKYPIILDRHSKLSKMIVRDYHLMFLHSGPQLTLSVISRTYYITCGMRVIKSVLSKCPKCLRYSGRCVSQQMAPLPSERLCFSFPFATTGIDYAGPIKVTPSRGRGVTSTKGYICIFICFVTRAIHVEIVSDLSTKAFLAAFERFYNRRNLPNNIHSDNGTTFQGAESEIAKLLSATSPQFKEIQTFVNNLGISWSFSPPYGPHFGGLWEAAVKSFKYHYKRVLGENSLTFEEHCTLAAQIEGCLNSRPLCTISTDSRDQIPLTPAHFLVGRPLRTLPPVSDVSDLAKTYKDRWTLLLAMRNNFWNTWKKEVLHQLIQTNKWKFPQRNLQVGDIVIITDKSTPATCWPLGRVTSVETNRSGLVRVVTVDTASSTFTRPVHKLIYLPVDDHASESYHSFLGSTSTCD